MRSLSDIKFKSKYSKYAVHSIANKGLLQCAKLVLNESHGQTVTDEWQPILRFPLERAKSTEVESLEDLSRMRRENDYFNIMFPQCCEDLRFPLNGLVVHQQNR
jgi:hypothetical protein